VIIQPQVNSMIRQGEDSDSRCLMSSWLAPAPSTRTRIFPRTGPGPARWPRPAPPCDRRTVSSPRCQAGAAWPGTRGYSQPMPPVMKAVAFQVGAAPSLSLYAVTSVASMSMTGQPARVFPVMTSHGKSAGVSSISFHTCARILAGACAILASVLVPARLRARRTVEPLGGAQHRRQLRQHRDIAHAGGARRDRDRDGHDHHAPAQLRELPCSRQRRLQCGCQPALVGQLPQQDAAAVPGQAGTVISDLQAVVPAVMLHGEERSSPGIATCGYRVISQDQGALRR
jgi:hypothetical protein